MIEGIAGAIARKDIIIISGKGGVGKTLIASLLAQELAKKGNTGLSDLDVDSSNIAKIMNVKMDEVELTEERKIVPIEFNENLKINSLSAMLSDSTISQSGAQYRRIVHDILLSTEWGDLDYMVMDMPPSSGDIFREVVDITKKNNSLLGALVVEQPRETEDCQRIYEICKRLFIPIIGFVENMSGTSMHGKPVLCPCGCGEEFAPFGNGGIKTLAKEVGGEFLGRIPLSYELANLRPPKVEGTGTQTLSKVAKKIEIAGLPKIPEDPIRKFAGSFKFVGNVVKVMLALGKQISLDFDLATIRSEYGRKKPGIIAITITDCPEALNEFKITYLRIGSKKVEFYKEKNLPSDADIIGGIKIGSGPMACVLKNQIPVLNPFTHQRYNEDYSLTKAINNGDAEMFGEGCWPEFILMDNLFTKFFSVSQN